MLTKTEKKTIVKIQKAKTKKGSRDMMNSYSSITFGVNSAEKKTTLFWTDG